MPSVGEHDVIQVSLLSYNFLNETAAMQHTLIHATDAFPAFHGLEGRRCKPPRPPYRILHTDASVYIYCFRDE